MTCKKQHARSLFIEIGIGHHELTRWTIACRKVQKFTRVQIKQSRDPVTPQFWTTCRCPSSFQASLYSYGSSWQVTHIPPYPPPHPVAHCAQFLCCWWSIRHKSIHHRHSNILFFNKNKINVTQCHISKTRSLHLCNMLNHRHIQSIAYHLWHPNYIQAPMKDACPEHADWSHALVMSNHDPILKTNVLQWFVWPWAAFIHSVCKMLVGQIDVHGQAACSSHLS